GEGGLNAAQEKLGRRIASAFRALEWNASLVSVGIGGARVEVRHPTAERDGAKWLVALVTLKEHVPRVTYAVPMYRVAVEKVMASAMERAKAARTRRAKGGA